MNRLLLLDGNAILHRAYHALPPLTTLDGRPAGAVYGFISMIIKLQGDLHPTHYAVAFDRPAPTFRKQLLESYQSQRPPMDEELSSQIEIIHEVLNAFGIPIYEMDGFEADDVIGTITKSVIEKKNGLSENEHVDQVIIVTGDRDILQLVVDDSVLVYMPVKGLSEAKLYSQKEVVERLGVLPTAIVDWKGLSGDSSDNYSGVPGIGPKTAVNLVTQFGTVERIYEAVEQNSSDITPRIKEKLIAGKEMATLSKLLATIRTDVPVDISLSACRVETLNTNEVRAAIETLGFSSLLKRISGIVPPVVQKKEEKKNDDSSQMDLFS